MNKELDDYEKAVKYGAYIERECYSRLIDWKQKYARNNKALFLRGPRRVGKSVLALEFAHKEYKSFINISFNKVSDSIKTLFVDNLDDLSFLYTSLEVYFQTKLYPGESLIILDEIQLYKPAKQAIKTLIEDGRYDILETGSLASIVKTKEKDEKYLLPSDEVTIDVRPITFREFLRAKGENECNELIEMCYKTSKPLGPAYRSIYRLFRNYLFVGGMPRPASVYIKTSDLLLVEEEKREIIKLYRDDFKLQQLENPVYVESLFDMIPSELSAHDKRFKLSHVNNGRSRELLGPFSWLIDARIVNPCFKANDPSSLPMLTADGNDFKAYLVDTGLFYSLSYQGVPEDELFYKSVILDKLHINEGMFAENYVSQSLVYNGHRLFYYAKRNEETRKTEIEVDFVEINNRKVTPIEVKSDDNITAKSLKKFKDRFPVSKTGCIFYDGDVKEDNGVLCLPIFMSECF